MTKWTIVFCAICYLMGLRTGWTKKAPAKLQEISLSSMAPTLLAPSGLMSFKSCSKQDFSNLQANHDQQTLSLRELTSQYYKQKELWREKFIVPHVKEVFGYFHDNPDAYEDFKSEIASLESVAPHWVGHSQVQIGGEQFDFYLDGEATTGSHQRVFDEQGNQMNNPEEPQFILRTTIIRNGAEVSNEYVPGLNHYMPTELRNGQMGMLDETFHSEKLSPYFSALLFFTPGTPSFEYFDTKSETWMSANLSWETKSDDEFKDWQDNLDKLTRQDSKK